jgi:hypothetical protein
MKSAILRADEGYDILHNGLWRTFRDTVAKHIPPDTTAMIFWLKNRRRDQWRDVHKHEANPGNPIDQMSPEELRASIHEDLKLLGMLPDGAPPTNRRGSRTLRRTPDCGGQTQ